MALIAVFFSTATSYGSIVLDVATLPVSIREGKLESERLCLTQNGPSRHLHD